MRAALPRPDRDGLRAGAKPRRAGRGLLPGVAGVRVWEEPLRRRPLGLSVRRCPQSFRFEHDAKPTLIHANLADWSNDGPMEFSQAQAGIGGRR